MKKFINIKTLDNEIHYYEIDTYNIFLKCDLTDEEILKNEAMRRFFVTQSGCLIPYEQIKKMWIEQ